MLDIGVPKLLCPPRNPAFCGQTAGAADFDLRRWSLVWIGRKIGSHAEAGPAFRAGVPADLPTFGGGRLSALALLPIPRLISACWLPCSTTLQFFATNTAA